MGKVGLVSPALRILWQVALFDPCTLYYQEQPSGSDERWEINIDFSIAHQDGVVRSLSALPLSCSDMAISATSECWSACILLGTLVRTRMVQA